MIVDTGRKARSIQQKASEGRYASDSMMPDCSSSPSSVSWVEFGGAQPDILQGTRELVARFAQAVLGSLADAKFPFAGGAAKT